MVEAVLPFDAEMQIVDVELARPRLVEAAQHRDRNADISAGGQPRRRGTPVLKTELPRDNLQRPGMCEFGIGELIPEHPDSAFGVLDGQVHHITHIPCAGTQFSIRVDRWTPWLTPRRYGLQIWVSTTRRT